MKCSLIDVLPPSTISSSCPQTVVGVQRVIVRPDSGPSSSEVLPLWLWVCGFLCWIQFRRSIARSGQSPTSCGPTCYDIRQRTISMGHREPCLPAFRKHHKFSHKILTRPSIPRYPGIEDMWNLCPSLRHQKNLLTN